MLTTCPSCQALVQPGDARCPNCGMRLSGISTQPLASSGQAAAQSGPPSSTGPLVSLHGTTTQAAKGVPLQINMLVGGRYRLVAPLGAGNMGRVWQASDERLHNRPCAIKHITLVSASTEERAWFEREAATLAGLDHPNICDIKDWFEEDGNGYLVLELINGRTLAEEVARRGSPGLPVPEVLAWARQLGDALAYLHSQKPHAIIFRDVKPQNIMLRTDGQIALIDFGIARPVVVTGGTTIGTPGYAPAEQYQGIAEPRSDQYALAATLHHLLTGRNPEQYAPFQFPPVRGLVPSLSPTVEAALAHALSMRVDDRYDSIEDFVANLLLQPGARSAIQPQPQPLPPGLRTLAPTDSREARRWPAQPPLVATASASAAKMSTPLRAGLPMLAGTAVIAMLVVAIVLLTLQLLTRYTSDRSTVINIQAPESVSLDAPYMVTSVPAGTPRSWINRVSGVGDFLDSISCSAPSICVAIGNAGAALASEDGGVTWTVRATGTGNQLDGISCARLCVAVGASGTIVTSADNGATWVSQSSGVSNQLNDISCENICVAVGANGAILTSADGGVTWLGRLSGTRQDLTGIACQSTGACVAVGTYGIILISTDGGATWVGSPSSSNPLSSHTTYPLYGVDCSRATTCAVVGDGGTILSSTDGGVTWVSYSSDLFGTLHHVSCGHTRNCVAVGVNGIVLTSEDGGVTWASQISGTSEQLMGVSCLSACVAVGADGTILTRNGPAAG